MLTEITLLAVLVHWVMGHFVTQFPAVRLQTSRAVSPSVAKAVMQRQCVNIGDGFGQLLGGEVFNRADVEALVYHAVGGAVVYAFASDKRGDGLPQRGAVVGGGFGGEAV